MKMFSNNFIYDSVIRRVNLVNYHYSLRRLSIDFQNYFVFAVYLAASFENPGYQCHEDCDHYKSPHNLAKHHFKFLLC